MFGKNQPKDQKVPEKNEKKDSAKPQKKEVMQEDLHKKCEEYLNGWKRAKADYQNLKKETEEKQKELIKFAGSEVIQDFLPLVDYFKFAFNHDIPKEYRESDWLKGMKHIQAYLNKILSDHGIQEIKTVGEKFNPELHEAVEQVEGKGESGLVIEEVGTGFIKDNKVLRPARVKVSR